MGLYRRLARSKRGMSTIFGGLFFVILILMGFNLMLWVFIQQDSYNSIVATMNQRDQAAVSENLEPQNPGAVSNTASCPCSFSIKVSDLGGSSVQIARIYITNTNPSGSSQCSGAAAPCIVNPAPSNTAYSFTAGNIAVGSINHLIPVTGISLNQTGDQSQYQIVLASTRGRLFSFSFPWLGVVSTTIINNNGKLFQTNIGPLSILFDYSSFEFTSTYSNASATKPLPAWVVPSNQPVIFWIKVQNTANVSVTLSAQSGILFQRYSSSSTGATTFFLADNSTTCCGTGVAYGANPITLPAANPLPAPPTFVKFALKGDTGSGSDNAVQGTPNNPGPAMLFIGFFYTLNGRFQGQTIPFVAVDNCGSPTYTGSPPTATSQCV